MKIAFPTDDGETISKHLGQARYFQVIDVEEGQVRSSERRDKASHSHQDHAQEHAAGVHPGQQMIEAIADCHVLISGGMGQPMYNRALSHGLRVYLTGEDSISSALTLFQQGKLASDPSKVHMH